MDKHDIPAKHRHAPPNDADESHIIRSDNKSNMNEQMYGNNREESSREQKQDGVKADPSSFPGGKKERD
ncbi:MAG: hypothetical protein LUE17_00285 [Planctomycetaceae bacterium]|nr:hypothetical protein [Planctomycetaceae bacterium]